MGLGEAPGRLHEFRLYGNTNLTHFARIFEDFEKIFKHETTVSLGGGVGSFRGFGKGV